MTTEPESPRIYETKKMRVEIGPDKVVKVFKKRSHYRTRYRREKWALQHMAGMEGVPTLIEFCDREPRLVTGRLPGDNVEHLSDEALTRIRSIVEEMLRRGVARHSLPIRDILIDDEGNVGMVDFERVSIRWFEWSPIWWIAKRITRFHFYRLCSQHSPGLLTPTEQRTLARGTRIRSAFRVFRKASNAVRHRGRDREK